MSEKVVFVLCDKLPTYYDAAVSIYMVATKPKRWLVDIWKRSFGDFMLQVEAVLLISCKNS